MRGFIYTELVELIERQQGEEFVDRWLDSCDLPSGGAYTAVATYPTSELVELVQRLSAMTEIPIPDLLKAYGEHLFGYLAKAHAGIMDGLDDPFELLAQLEQHVHVEVRKLYSDAEVPTFEVESRSETEMALVYSSVRAMPDLAHGLIHGAAKHFGRPIAIERDDLAGDGTQVRFRLTMEPPAR